MSTRISRFDYASMYGPTTGDKIRLADTELFIKIEKDFTAYGTPTNIELTKNYKKRK